MKKTKITQLVMIAAFLLYAGINSFAQTTEVKPEKPRSQRMHEMLNLTEDQELKIKELSTAHRKEILQIENQLNELTAKQQTLSSAEKADMKAINSNIDEISASKNKIMKLEAKHNQDVRNLLTDEQRIIYDSHKIKQGSHYQGQKGREHKGRHSKEHGYKKYNN